jgi:uncharacterized protein (TIGR03437 family)
MKHILKIATRVLLVYTVVVALQHCQSEDNEPKVEDPALSIQGISPDTGPSGTAVTITGTGFSASAADNTVELNGKTCSVTNATTTQLTITIPTEAASGKIKVTVKGRSVESAASFTYTTDPTGNQTCTPDPAFGTNGFAITEVEGVTTGDFTFVHNNAVQSDGKNYRHW